ncbi:MAG: class I SAM-dependent methyltransferase [Planctomycetes bacterium]|nr:class I SAM-dependent methyltransferase [Planctomycetota bacterium]
MQEEPVEYGCIACWCGADGAREAIRGDGWRILVCRACGTGRTDPPPPDPRDAPLSRAYAKRARLFERYMDRLLDVLERETGDPSGRRLLDVGCGPGILLDRARRRAWSAEGIEPSQTAAAAARAKGFPVSPHPIEKAGLAPATYDAVVFSASLEHVRRPRAALEAAREALRADGILVVEVPNAASLPARILGARWHALAPDAHRWHFAPAALERLIGEAGLAPIRTIVYEPRAPIGRTPRGVLRHIALLPIRAAAAISGTGSSIIAVAARGAAARRGSEERRSP